MGPVYLVIGVVEQCLCTVWFHGESGGKRGSDGGEEGISSRNRGNNNNVMHEASTGWSDECLPRYPSPALPITRPSLCRQSRPLRALSAYTSCHDIAKQIACIH